MNRQQNDHVNHIAGQFAVLMKRKYAEGQTEHGGNLWERTVLELTEDALDEATDLVVYLITVRDKLRGREDHE